MYYRTRLYLAGDWDGDYDIISEIQKWNSNPFWNLSFSDAHDLMQARDTSLACSIKSSLRERISASKTFVLIVGNHTCNLTKGSCQFCYKKALHYGVYSCISGNHYDSRSFVEYECEMVLKIILILLLYITEYVYKEKNAQNVLDMWVDIFLDW